MTAAQVSWLSKAHFSGIEKSPGLSSRPATLISREASAHRGISIRSWRKVFLWSFLSLFLPPSASSQEPGPGSVQGRIRAEDGTPVRAVLVRVFPPGAENASGGSESDELGYYHIERLPP